MNGDCDYCGHCGTTTGKHVSSCPNASPLPVLGDHERAIIRAQSLRGELQPHRLVKDVAGCLWETITYPWADQRHVWVNIRVPGDPTTIFTVEAYMIFAESGRTCVCDRAGEHYFREPPEQAAKRQTLRQMAQGFFGGLGSWN